MSAAATICASTPGIPPTKQNAIATDSATSVIGGNTVLVTSGQGRSSSPDTADIVAASQRLSVSLIPTNIADRPRKTDIIPQTLCSNATADMHPGADKVCIRAL